MYLSATIFDRSGSMRPDTWGRRGIDDRTAYSTDSEPSRRTLPVTTLVTKRLVDAIERERSPVVKPNGSPLLTTASKAHALVSQMVKRQKAVTTKTPIIQTGVLKALRTLKPPKRAIVRTVSDAARKSGVFAKTAGESPISDKTKTLYVKKGAIVSPAVSREVSVPVNTEQPVSLVAPASAPVVSDNPPGSYAVNEADVDLVNALEPTETVFDQAVQATTTGGTITWLLLGLGVFAASMFLGSPPGRRSR